MLTQKEGLEEGGLHDFEGWAWSWSCWNQKISHEVWGWWQLRLLQEGKRLGGGGVNMRIAGGQAFHNFFGLGGELNMLQDGKRVMILFWGGGGSTCRLQLSVQEGTIGNIMKHHRMIMS